MNVIILSQVQKFIGSLDPHLCAHIYSLIGLLEEYGHDLGMPAAKPIGNGFWELRVPARPAIRVLYGFCDGGVVLVHALKKQRSALLSREINLAKKRFKAYCI